MCKTTIEQLQGYVRVVQKNPKGPLRVKTKKTFLTLSKTLDFHGPQQSPYSCTLSISTPLISLLCDKPMKV